MHQNFIKSVGYGNKGYSLLLKDSKKIRNIILISGSNSNYTYIQNRLLKILKKKAKHILLKENRFDLNYLEKIFAFNKNKTNTIIALGGGSIIDFSKRLVLKLRNNKKINFYIIPTILGSGAESSISSIINEPIKKNFDVNEEFLPDGIIYDENLIKSVGKIKILMGILDAFSHCLESLTSINKNLYLNFLSVQTLNSFIKNNPLNNLLNKNQFNLNEIASLSLNGGLAQSNAGSGICHALTHSSEKILNINHSEGISFFINPVLRYLLIKNKKDLKEFDKKLYKYIFKLNKYINEKGKFKKIRSSIQKKGFIEDLINHSKNDICWKLYNKNINVNLLIQCLKNENS